MACLSHLCMSLLSCLAKPVADLLRAVVRSVSIKKQQDVSLRYSKLQATRSASCYVSQLSSQPAMSDLVPTFIGHPISHYHQCGELQPLAETTGDLPIVAHSPPNFGNVMVNARMPSNSNHKEDVVRGYDNGWLMAYHLHTSCTAAKHIVLFVCVVGGRGGRCWVPTQVKCPNLRRQRFHNLR